MIRHGPLALTLALVLGACAQPPRASVAGVEPTGDALADAAALLVAADNARDAAARTPLVERLDAMGVTVAKGESEDPLDAWRAEREGSATTPYRGRALGPAYRRARVEAGQSMTLEQIFYAGERAEIVAQATGDAEIGLAISNPRTETVCTRSLKPRAQCRWLPLFTERFSIELENRGARSASVYIVIR